MDLPVAVVDYWPPAICGSKCIPRNGEIDVDPEKYPEKLIVAFNEPVEAIVLSTEPEFDFVAGLIEKSKKLEIVFVDYIMTYGTKIDIDISITDRTGNQMGRRYSFTTAKPAR